MKTRFHKLLCAALALCICLSVISIGAFRVHAVETQSTDAVELTVPDVSGAPGEDVTVAVRVDSNPGIISALLNVSYDTSVLTLTGVSDGGILGEYIFGKDLTAVPYKLLWENGLATTNYTNTGVLVYLTFRIADNAAPGSHALTVNCVECLDKDLNLVPGTVTGGTVTVITETITGLRVATKPSKTSYYVGDSLDTTGLTLTATYSDGSTATITSGFTCTPSVLNTAGTQTITVTYGGATATFQVTVAQRPTDMNMTVVGATGAAGDTVDVVVRIDSNPGIISALLNISYDTSVLTLTGVTDGGILGEYIFGKDITAVPYKLLWENGLATSNFTSTGNLVTLTFKIADNAPDGTYEISVTPVASDFLDVNLEQVSCSVSQGSVTVSSAPAIELFSIFGANMTLGNELAMNFFVKMSDLDGTDYYAQILRTYSDGRADVTMTIPYEQWGNNGSYKMFTATGIAAKEMTEEIYITIYRNDGVQASHVWEDSVAAYVKRNITKWTGKTRTMGIDMLNYGAAAQEYFKYNLNDLANAGLDDYQQYATADVECVDSRVKGTNYYGSNLTLESCILLTMYFKNITPEMNAVVTFTDHYGRAQTVNIPGSEFQKNGSFYGIVIDELVVADSRQLVTCKVYNASGTEVASAVDSVESYIARMSTDYPVFQKIMNFADGAYNYFHS